MSDDAFGQIFAKLTRLEQRLTAHLIGAHQTLTALMGNQFEPALNRLTAIECDLGNLRSEHGVTSRFAHGTAGDVPRSGFASWTIARSLPEKAAF